MVFSNGFPARGPHKNDLHTGRHTPSCGIDGKTNLPILFQYRQHSDIKIIDDYLSYHTIRVLHRNENLQINVQCQAPTFYSDSRSRRRPCQIQRLRSRSSPRDKHVTSTSQQHYILILIGPFFTQYPAKLLAKSNNKCKNN